MAGPELPRTMAACAMTCYGGPEVLQELELPVPKMVADQLLVRVCATSVNPADCKQRAGNLRKIVKHEFPCVLGQDFAGVIVAVGARCSRFGVGDEVYGSTAPRNGCSAEFVAVYEREVSKMPPSLDFVRAAAVPTIGCTAFKGIVLIGQAKAAQRILVHGASGGVGAAAVQIARSLGCEVLGTCSERNAGYIRSLGARPLDYNTTFEKEVEPASLDLVFDSVGGDEYYRRSLRLLKPGGLYVSAVGPVLHGGSELVTYGQMLSTAATLIPRMVGNLFAARPYRLYLGFETEVLGQVTALIEGGKLDTRIDPASFDLSTLGEAHAKCETGHSDGKLVVAIRPPLTPNSRL